MGVLLQTHANGSAPLVAAHKHAAKQLYKVELPTLPTHASWQSLLVLTNPPIASALDHQGTVPVSAMVLLEHSSYYRALLQHEQDMAPGSVTAVALPHPLPLPLLEALAQAMHGGDLEVTPDTVEPLISAISAMEVGGCIAPRCLVNPQVGTVVRVSHARAAARIPRSMIP